MAKPWNFVRQRPRLAFLHKRATWIEGLHDAVRTYTRTILSRSLVSFCMVRYGEKQQTQLLLLIYFIARFEISTKCVF